MVIRNIQNQLKELKELKKRAEMQDEEQQLQNLQEQELVAQGSQQIALYRESKDFVLESILKAEQGLLPDVQTGESLVKSMMDSIANEPDLLLAATDRSQEFAVSTHSVNVSVLALKLTQTLRYNEARRVRVGLAGLVHEVGVVRLPKELIYKTGKLTTKELDLLRRRPEYSAGILKELGPRYGWLVAIVGQVFEREDGTGFPRGLTGKNIREEAKLVGMADVFEACIHDRPYRKGLTGYQTVLELTSEHTRSFSDRIVKVLLRGFSLYPYNEYVVLSTGEIARVVDINEENLFRPSVSILYDRDGKKLEQPRLTNLALNPSLYVSKAITAAALPRS